MTTQKLRWSKNINEIQTPGKYPAKSRQAVRIAERRINKITSVSVLGFRFDVFPGVYDTGSDTVLMAKAVRILPTQTYLEIGIGCGAISLLLARRCRSGLGVDINSMAVRNSQHNQKLLGIKNVTFRLGNVFHGIKEKFDVIVCNPPYSNSCAHDNVDRMFWDTQNSMKRRFFWSAGKHLHPGGRIYFGWANFADIDGVLMLQWAHAGGLRYVRHCAVKGKTSPFRFFVIELQKI